MMKEKNTLVGRICVFSDFIILMRKYIFLKIYATSEGAVSHNVLYYQQLSNAFFE